MIDFKRPAEVELIRQSAQIVSRTLGVIAEAIRPGVTTLYLDKLAETFIRDNGAKPGFLGLYKYPNTLCTSVNEQVVHGIPNDHELQEGDIVSVDCGAFMNGFYGDHAYTFAIGEVSEEKKRLMKVTYESLLIGIEQVKQFNKIGDISYAIQKHCEQNGYGVVRELVGHGLGRKMHEPPQVPNFGHARRGPVMKNGIVLAIEPMINLGKPDVYTLNDKWTVVTKDKMPSAHFEHDVAVVGGKAVVLSTFEYVEEALRKKGDFIPTDDSYIPEIPIKYS
ncbi:MAG: type I methionyl aminopeptidase [Candidatus Kapabacteria bacterium]|nr:type I methionyl aminopeptidase [Ignavibacteriota bacterium]MCW5884986.1 type I methionyl aminopeptidase [Candidatus Kapabacteria bacterium]